MSSNFSIMITPTTVKPSMVALKKCSYTCSSFTCPISLHAIFWLLNIIRHEVKVFHTYHFKHLYTCDQKNYPSAITFKGIICRIRPNLNKEHISLLYLPPISPSYIFLPYLLPISPSYVSFVYLPPISSSYISLLYISFLYLLLISPS